MGLRFRGVKETIQGWARASAHDSLHLECKWIEREKQRLSNAASSLLSSLWPSCGLSATESTPWFSPIHIQSLVNGLEHCKRLEMSCMLLIMWHQLERIGNNGENLLKAIFINKKENKRKQTNLCFFFSRELIKSLAWSEMSSKLSSSNSYLAAVTRAKVSASLFPWKGDSPLSLGHKTM